jgi:HPt (histidine-containing phosphotransfer) domain-containing protein
VATAAKSVLPARPDAAAVPVFDIGHFERQTFGDAGLQQEILVLFKVQLDETGLTLATPMTATDWRFLAHTLKGAAAAVGAFRIAELAGTWEQHGAPRDAAARAHFLGQFEAERRAYAEAISGLAV